MSQIFILSLYVTDLKWGGMYNTSYVITLYNKNRCADVHHYITVRILAHRDVFVQVRS
jgi:hypothetical protein